MQSSLQFRVLCLLFTYQYLNVACREEKGKRITMFFDMGNAGLSNVDIPFISYLISLFKLYYPDLLNAIVVFELPFIMNGETTHGGEVETSGSRCFSNELVADCHL